MKKGWGQGIGWGQCFVIFSPLWHCWLGDRKDIWSINTLCHLSPKVANFSSRKSGRMKTRGSSTPRFTWQTAVRILYIICLKFLCGQGTMPGRTTDGWSYSAGTAPTGDAVSGPGLAEVHRTCFATDLPIRQRTGRPQVPVMPPPRLHSSQNRAKNDFGSLLLLLLGGIAVLCRCGPLLPTE